MRLSSAIDQEIYVAVQKIVSDGKVRADVDVVYNAIQKSNSSLKRKPKKVLQASIERVLDFMNLDLQDSHDSEAELDRQQPQTSRGADLMNKSLRANLAATAEAPASPPAIVEDVSAKKRRLANGEPIPKRQRAEKVSTAPPTEPSLLDIGGMDDVVLKLGEHLVVPMKDSESFQEAGVTPPRGILLHGPPGCGKTMLCRAWAAHLKVPFVEILGPSIVSSMSGDSEKNIRERFEEAKRSAPCLIFIDEIDSIAPKRSSSQSQMEQRMVAQLLVSLDELKKDPDRPVMVLAATNRPDSLDPALRRGGRFNTEISINVPDEQVRRHILIAQTRQMTLADDVDLRKLAKLTTGFVGADLEDLVGKAGTWRMDRYRRALSDQAQALNLNGYMEHDYEGDNQEYLDQIAMWDRLIARLDRKDIPKPPGFERFELSMADFLAVLPGIIPSSKREGFTTVPDVSWNDIGGDQSIRKKLEAAIVEPIKDPEWLRRFGVEDAGGVLLWGPPGCGKTLLAKATAGESGANFISVKGPELVDKFVGETEAGIRRLFARARSSVPCVIFFDEIDALAPKRSDSGDSGVMSRIVGTLLTELDGLDERSGIYVIGATNRPDVIDDGLLRQGRLGTPIFVGPPDQDQRVDVLNTIIRGRPVDNVSEIVQLARQCDNYSGADLKALYTAAVRVTRERRGDVVTLSDFMSAKTSIKGSIDLKAWEALKKRIGGEC